MASQPYLSDLTDAEFSLLEPHLPAPSAFGRSWAHPLRSILNGIFYVVRTGCQWRYLPQEYPPWPTVYWWFRRWRLDGTWSRLNMALRELARIAAGREPQPSAAILDSESVKTTSIGGLRGFDGAKKISGRKRHVLVDTQGLVLTVTVHRADVQDRAVVPQVLESAGEQFPRIQHVFVDQGYTGGGKRWIEEQLGWSVEVVKHPPKPRGVWAPIGAKIDWDAIMPKGFRGMLPRRWVVERTFSWFGQSRRLSKEYVRLCPTSEAMIYATMTRLLLQRLSRVSTAQ